MKKILLFVLIFSFLYVPHAKTFEAIITFTEPIDPTFITGVFVSEISGDYSECCGQLSKPGETTVIISNIKPLTTYYFSAKRYDPSTWASSNWSDEMKKVIPANVAPIMVELPPLPMCDKIVSITVEIK